jgi:hypothetical protein
MILMVVILMASLTIAAGGNSVKIQGVITAIGDNTITVNAITVQIKNGTQIYEKTEAGCVEIDFDDLVIGDRVNVIGQFDGAILVANKIIVH